MSTGELVAWQAGVDWSRAGLPAAAAAVSSNRQLAAALTPAGAEALRQLGRDIFAYWFFRGFDDHQAAGVS